MKQKLTSVCVVVAASLFASTLSHGAVVAHYSFDNGGVSLFNDSSGNGYNGIAGSAGTQVGGGAFGSSAVQLNGTSDYLNLPPAIAAAFGSGQGTLSMWIALDNNIPGGGGQTGFEGLGNPALLNSHYPWTDGNGYFTTFRQNNRVDGVNLGAFDRTGLHMVTVTADGSGWNLYQNGSLLATAPADTFAFNSSSPSIGKSFAGFFLQGKIDEVWLYNQSLNSAQINSLHLFNDIAHVPEPSTLMLLSLGIGTIVMAIRRRNSRKN